MVDKMPGMDYCLLASLSTRFGNPRLVQRGLGAAKFAPLREVALGGRSLALPPNFRLSNSELGSTQAL